MYVKVGEGGETYVLTCEHCGESYSVALPIAVTMFVVMTRSWSAAHRKCPKPSSSSPG